MHNEMINIGYASALCSRTLFAVCSSESWCTVAFEASRRCRTVDTVSIVLTSRWRQKRSIFHEFTCIQHFVSHINSHSVKTMLSQAARDSASTVLTATGQVNGRWRADCNKIPHDWLRPQEDPLNQIWYKSIRWGLLGIWVNVFVPFLFIYLYLFYTRVQVRPVDGFLRAIAH